MKKFKNWRWGIILSALLFVSTITCGHAAEEIVIGGLAPAVRSWIGYRWRGHAGCHEHRRG